MRQPFALAGLVLFAAALTAGTGLTAQTTGPEPPRLGLRSVAGRDLFQFYCASCHGRDGRGGGTVAAALKTPPPDLTSLRARLGGAFPRVRVEAYVRSEEGTPAHGSREMPVWGPIFVALDGSDTRAAIRIANVVAYIESLQRP